MARYEPKDHYYQKAKAEGRASRASYKIEEIQAKYRLMKPGHKVVDLGCAPGGWLQLLAGMVGPTGRVLGIDLVPVTIALAPNVAVVQADIAIIAEAPTQVTTLLGGPADVVVSDMAPHTTGVKFNDSYRSYELANSAWECARSVLKPGGAFIAKIFDGPDVVTLRKALQTAFQRVETFSPKASRDGSRELYLVAIGLK